MDVDVAKDDVGVKTWRKKIRVKYMSSGNSRKP